MQDNSLEVVGVNRKAWNEIKKLLTKDTLMNAEDINNPNTSLIILRTLQEYIKLKEERAKVSFTRQY